MRIGILTVSLVGLLLSSSELFAQIIDDFSTGAPKAADSTITGGRVTGAAGTASSSATITRSVVANKTAGDDDAEISSLISSGTLKVNEDSTVDGQGGVVYNFGSALDLSGAATVDVDVVSTDSLGSISLQLLLNDGAVTEIVTKLVSSLGQLSFDLSLFTSVDLSNIQLLALNTAGDGNVSQDIQLDNLGVTAANVPEPASIALWTLMLGAVGAFFVARRRRAVTGMVA